MNDLEILNIHDKNIETLIGEHFCCIDFENDSVKEINIKSHLIKSFRQYTSFKKFKKLQIITIEGDVSHSDMDYLFFEDCFNLKSIKSENKLILKPFSLYHCFSLKECNCLEECVIPALGDTDNFLYPLISNLNYARYKKTSNKIFEFFFGDNEVLYPLNVHDSELIVMSFPRIRKLLEMLDTYGVVFEFDPYFCAYKDIDFEKFIITDNLNSLLDVSEYHEMNCLEDIMLYEKDLSKWHCKLRWDNSLDDCYIILEMMQRMEKLGANSERICLQTADEIQEHYKNKDFTWLFDEYDEDCGLYCTYKELTRSLAQIIARILVEKLGFEYNEDFSFYCMELFFLTQPEFFYYGINIDSDGKPVIGQTSFHSTDECNALECLIEYLNDSEESSRLYVEFCEKEIDLSYKA